MKLFKKLLVFFLVINIFNSCEKEEEVSYALQDVSAPQNINAVFDISQEEEGLVSVTPTADGATSFEVYFGDEENETPIEIAPGDTLEHLYEGEGEFNLRIVAVGLTGLTSELVRVVTISSDPPSELEVDISTSSLEVTVTPTATNATVYDIYFGEEEDEEPKTIMNTESATYTYAESGTYTVRVIARGSGSASAEFSEEITVTEESNPVKFPLTFDEEGVNYDFETFNGVSFEVVENPDASGANDVESNVGAITNSGNEFEGVVFELDEAVDFSGDNKTITMKFWSDVPLPLLLKFEDGVNDERENEVVANHGGTGWEEITFNFAANAITSYIDESQPGGEPFVPTGEYLSAVLFVDGPGTTDGTFYIDDVAQAEGDGDGDSDTEFATSLPIDFESNETFSGVFEADQGVTGNLVENPDMNDDNPSDMVFEFTKASGAAWYSGIFQILSEDLDLSTEKSFSFKIWSPKGGINVRMNLEKEGEGGGPPLSIDQTLTEENTWVTLTYNFSDLIADGDAYDKLVIFPEFDEENETPGDGSVYYIDDLEQTSGGDAGNGDGGDDTCVPEANESLSAADFNLTFLTNDLTVVQDNATYVRTDNPGEDSVNNSCFVGEVTNSNQNPWDNIQIDLDNKLDFNANAGFKIKVYSPEAGKKVTIKLEEIGNADNNMELGVETTKTNEWEELTIPFPSNASGEFNKIVLFFDLESTNGDTYYFDDLKLYPRTDGNGGNGDGNGDGNGNGDGGAIGDLASNGDFETGNLDGWAVYENGGIIEADDSDSNGGDWSARIVASSPDGLNPTLKQERKGAGSVAVGDIVEITFDYKGSAAAGGIYSIQSFVEAAEGVNQTEVFSVTPTDTWQTFTTTYTVADGDVDGGITLEFTPICGGDPACNSTLNLDNVSITLNP